MKNLYYAMICLAALSACQNSGAPASQPSEASTSPAGTHCYIRAEGQDTTFVTLTIAADGTVTGSYDWVPWEKDGARGTVAGKMEGEMINLMYDYTIEGSNQQQEMLLKMSGDQLAEAEGELVEGDGGVLKLKDRSSVSYVPFTKISCQ